MVSDKEIGAAREVLEQRVYDEGGCEAEQVPAMVREMLEAAARVRAEGDAGGPVAESIESYYRRQIEWSRNTFGPGTRTKGVIDHIRKELAEIEAEPDDLSEWVDVIILAMDGFWRHGGSADDLMSRLLEKQRKNFARKWPDWRTMSPDKAIEHDRSCDARPAPQPSGTVHPDDLAVDRFAAAMKDKLAKKRVEGRGGWEDKEQCSAGFLSRLLREHVEKGDPVDVANLAMMLHQRGETISTLTASKPEQAVPSGTVEALKRIAQVKEVRRGGGVFDYEPALSAMEMYEIALDALSALTAGKPGQGQQEKHDARSA